MVWSNWRGPVVMIFAWVSLAWSQAPTPTAPASSGERFMTVHENGKSIRCRLVLTWHLPDGSPAYQVQAVHTGEMLTIVEDGAPPMSLEGKAKAVPMRIFHWGASQVSPPGVPAPTGAVIAASATVPESKAANPNERIMTVHENGKSVRCRLVSTWQQQDGSTGYQLQVLDSGEMMTIVEDGPPTRTLAGKAQAMPMRIFRWGKSRVSPAGAPAAHGPVVTTGSCGSDANVQTCTAGKEQIIWWEEKDGKRVTPLVVTSGKNPFMPSRTMAAPAAPAAPVVLDKATSVVNADNAAPAPLARTAVQTTPPKVNNPQPEPPSQGSTAQDAAPQARPEPTPVSTPVSTPVAASAPTQRIVTNAEAASATKPHVVAKEARPTPGTKVPEAPKLPVPFSTASDPSANRKFTTVSQDKGDEIRSNGPIKNWRNMWGHAKQTQAQVPGQAMVEQASVKPDARSLPKGNPPTSVADDKSGDILLAPERFVPGEKMAAKGINMSAYRGDPTKSLAMLQPPAPPQAKAPPANQKLPAAQPPALSAGTMPPGSHSVFAAGSNAPTGMTFVPVPVATVPDPHRVPAPPAAKVPAPPTPNGYVNAFGPPPAPAQGAQPQNPMLANAFSNPNAQVNPATRPYAQVPGYGPGGYMPSPYANIAQPYAAMPGYQAHPGVTAPHNPYAHLPQGYAMQHPGMQHPGMQQPGMPHPGMQHPAMVMQTPPVAQTTYPQNYAAPQAPLPNTGPQYQPVPAQTTSYNPAMDRRQGATPPASDLAPVIQLLRESPYPAQREWAANALSACDWRAHPEVVQLLLQCAQQDPAPTVRTGCIYSLGRMNAATDTVLSTLHALRGDADPRVRQEVEQTLGRLGATRP